MLGLLRDVHEDPDQVIAVRFTLVSPQTTDRLCLGRHRPEPLLQLKQRLGHDFVGDGLAVIEPEREQDLVASE